MSGVGPRDRRGVHTIPLLHPRSRSAPRVSGYTASRLTSLRIYANCDHGLGIDFEVDRVRVGNLTPGDHYRRGAIESKSFQRRGVNTVDASVATSWKSDRSFRNGKIATAEGVRYLEAQSFGTNGQVECLAESGIFECGGARLSLRSGDYYRWHWIRVQRTNGDGGILLGSTSCGIETHVATQCESSSWRGALRVG